MKISKKRLQEIIREELNEASFADKFMKTVDKHHDKLAQNALHIVRQKIMKDYKVGKTTKQGTKVTRKLVATLINNGVKEIRNKVKSPGLKKALQKIIDIREKQLKKMKEGKLTEARMVSLNADTKYWKKVVKVFKKLRLKSPRDYDLLPTGRNTFTIKVNKKYYDKVLEVLIKNKIKVHGT